MVEDFVVVNGRTIFVKKEELQLDNMGITHIRDIQGLENLGYLKGLNLKDNYISEIDGLDHLTDLEYLNLKNNQITEILGLGNLNNLQRLYLDDNPVVEELDRILGRNCPIENLLEYSRKLEFEFILLVSQQYTEQPNIFISSTIEDKKILHQTINYEKEILKICYEKFDHLDSFHLDFSELKQEPKLNNETIIEINYELKKLENNRYVKVLRSDSLGDIIELKIVGFLYYEKEYLPIEGIFTKLTKKLFEFLRKVELGEIKLEPGTGNQIGKYPKSEFCSLMNISEENLWKIMFILSTGRWKYLAQDSDVGLHNDDFIFFGKNQPFLTAEGRKLIEQGEIQIMKGNKTEQPNIFISSTIEDKKILRQIIKDLLESKGYILVMSEYPETFPKPVSPKLNTFESSIAPIKDCDIFVLIVGKKYGNIETGKKISIIEAEYNEAVTQNIPKIVFIEKSTIEKYGLLENIKKNREWNGKEKIDAINSLFKTLEISGYDNPKKTLRLVGKLSKLTLSSGIQNYVDNWRWNYDIDNIKQFKEQLEKQIDSYIKQLGFSFSEKNASPESISNKKLQILKSDDIGANERTIRMLKDAQDKYYKSLKRENIENEFNIRISVNPLKIIDNLINMDIEMKNFLERVQHASDCPYDKLFGELTSINDGFMHISQKSIGGNIFIKSNGIILYDWCYNNGNKILQINYISAYLIGFLYFLYKFCNKINYTDEISFNLNFENIIGYRYKLDDMEYEYKDIEFEPFEEILTIKQIESGPKIISFFNKIMQKILRGYGFLDSLELPLKDEFKFFFENFKNWNSL